MKFINLTRNEVAVISNNGRIAIPASDVAAYCTVKENVVKTVNGIDLIELEYSPVKLPPERDDTGLILSRVAATAAMIQSHGDRSDIYVPHGQIKDGSGRIMGCRSLQRFM